MLLNERHLRSPLLRWASFSLFITRHLKLSMKPLNERVFQVPACLLALFAAPCLWGQGFGNAIATADYRNSVYSPTSAIAGASLTQAASVALFGGNVGKPASTNAPNNGIVFLTKSSFGQPVQTLRNPDIDFGEEIKPDIALGVDLSQAPAVIDPPQKAFYVPGLGKVFATDPGFVWITWTRSNSTPVGPVRYLIGNFPARPPMGLYHTHYAGVNLNTNPPQTLAPLVDVSAVPQIVIHWNSAIPDNGADPYIARVANKLYAKERQGLIFFEYRQNGLFLNYEIVAVRPDTQPDVSASAVSIGDQLAPSLSVTNPAVPVVSRGVDLQNPANSFAYQHQNQSSVQYGNVWAIKSTGSELDLELYWRVVGVAGVVWPYELHRYNANWPTDPSKYQRYVRGTNPAWGIDVQLPGNLNASLMPFQEPLGHANNVANNSFLTTGAGWSLLRYLPTNNVSFQVVHSVLHDDASQYDLSLRDWNIGSEITEHTHA